MAVSCLRYLNSMKTDPPGKPDPLPDGRKKYHYFLDSVKIDTEQSSITGADVRAQLPPDKSGYSLFLESQGNDPDKQVQDPDGFTLEKKTLRFYSVPPANFGTQ